MEQSYFTNPPFRIPLTPVASASGSPYDCQHLGSVSSSAFDDFTDASAPFQAYGFVPDNCLYESPYPPMTVQTPVSVGYSPRMPMDTSMDIPPEGVGTTGRGRGDSQSLSDSPEITTEEVKRRRRERRRAQNRAAQRAFRLRKEETIKEISAKLSEMELEMERMEQSNEDLGEQIHGLQLKIRALERENEELRATSPSLSSINATSRRPSLTSRGPSFSTTRGRDDAAMANGC